MPSDLRPHYAEQFRCIGPDCKDHCCHGWEIVVDQASYEKYRELPLLRPVLDQYFAPVTNGRTSSRYVNIQTDVNSNCPLLDEDRLCNIHKQYGEDYLCHTCATYPRSRKQIDGVRETALLLSCPEAARQVLLHPDLLSGFEPSYSRFRSIDPPDVRSSFLWKVRELTFVLLKDRRLPLWQRLFLVGTLCRRLEEMSSLDEPSMFPNLIADFADEIDQGQLRAAMESIPTRTTLQLTMILDVVRDSLIHTNPALCSLQECLSVFSEGLQLAQVPDIATAAAHYVVAQQNYFALLMRKHPYLLENYLINQVFCCGFPFNTVPNAQDYIWICVQFALVKGLLIGMAGDYKEAFAPEHVVKLVQSFSKAVEHQPAFREALNWQGLADPECLAALLKSDADSDALEDSSGDYLAQRRTVLEPVA